MVGQTVWREARKWWTTKEKTSLDLRKRTREYREKKRLNLESDETARKAGNYPIKFFRTTKEGRFTPYTRYP